MDTPPIGTTVHYRAEDAKLGGQDKAPGCHPDCTPRCQAAIVTNHDQTNDGTSGVLSLAVFGDTGWLHHQFVYPDPANGWEDYTPGTWHHIH